MTDFYEYPKMTYRLSADDVVEFRVVFSAAEEDEVSADGYSSDVTSVYNKDTGEKLPYVGKRRKKAPADAPVEAANPAEE